jgi:hypothetical protein
MNLKRKKVQEMGATGVVGSCFIFSCVLDFRFRLFKYMGQYPMQDKSTKGLSKFYKDCPEVSDIIRFINCFSGCLDRASVTPQV